MMYFELEYCSFFFFKLTSFFVSLAGFPQHISAGFWNILLSRRPKLLSSSFKWRPELIENVHNYQRDLIGDRNFTTVVGVHVRMQDYLKLLSTYNKDVIVPQEKYFKRAMDYFKKKYDDPLFLVVSNDMKWVQENVRGPDVVYAGQSPSRPISFTCCEVGLVLSRF
jgi:Glycosyl transferase family 11